MIVLSKYDHLTLPKQLAVQAIQHSRPYKQSLKVYFLKYEASSTFKGPLYYTLQVVLNPSFGLPNTAPRESHKHISE